MVVMFVLIKILAEFKRNFILFSSVCPHPTPRVYFFFLIDRPPPAVKATVIYKGTPRGKHNIFLLNWRSIEHNRLHGGPTFVERREDIAHNNFVD
jgi:hypothetical protein